MKLAASKVDFLPGCEVGVKVVLVVPVKEEEKIMRLGKSLLRISRPA